MKKILSIRQIILVTVVLIAVTVLTVLHFINPEFDHPRVTLFLLSLIVPMVLPPLDIDKVSRAGKPFTGFVYLIFSYSYGTIIGFLGKTFIVKFFGANTSYDWLNNIIIILCGLAICIGCNIISHGIEEQRPNHELKTGT